MRRSSFKRKTELSEQTRWLRVRMVRTGAGKILFAGNEAAGLVRECDAEVVQAGISNEQQVIVELQAAS